MMKISNDMPIEALEINNRVFNLLKRNNINTVGELLALSESDFRQFRNSGVKSVGEFLDIQQKILSNTIDTKEWKEKLREENPTILNILDERSKTEEYADILFCDNDGVWHKDLDISFFDISDIKKKTLRDAGYDSMLKIVLELDSTIRNLKNFGRTYYTILQGFENRMLIYYPVNHSNKTANMIAGFIGAEYSSNEKLSDVIENAVCARVYRYEGVISATSLSELLEDRNLLTFIYRDESVRDLIEKYILGVMRDDAFEYYELRKMVPASLIASCRLDDILFEMKSKNLIEETEEGYQKYLPNLIDWIRIGLKNDRERDIFRKRISDVTLDKIGRDYNVTRERIRQIEAKAKKKSKNVRFKEERYIYWFENYNFTKEQFCTVFNILPASYDSVEYLSGLSEKEKMDRKSVVDALEDERLTMAMSKRFRRALSDKYFLFEDEYVVIKENSVLEALLRKKHSDNSIRVSNLIKEYNSVVSEFNLDLNLIEEGSDSEDHRIENKLMHFRNAIKREKRQFRYYEYDNYDFEEFFKNIDFSAFLNTEISTLKIMNMYPELMEQYDIKAPYELHFIIQKYDTLAKQNNINKQTAPNIIIGTASRELQVRGFIYKLAPITLENFAKAYEAEYGVEAATVLGTYNDFYNDYVKDGRVLDVMQEPMRDDELFKMKSALTEDFYFLEDFEKNYLALFPEGNAEKINHYNIKRLGFKINSTYAFRNTYSNVDDCFCAMFIKYGGLSREIFDRRFVSVQQFYTSRDKMKKNYDLLEVRDGEYITFEKLSEQYPEISKKDLKDYAKKAIEYASGDVFTIYSLRKAGFTHKLDVLNQSEIFYAGLICIDKTVYNSRTFGDIFFSKTNSSINIPAFVQNAFEEMNRESVGIIELMDYMMDEYGVYVKRYDIPGFIREKGYYYLPDTEKIYLTYEDYLKDIV